MALRALFTTALLALPAFAKTDIGGCTTIEGTYTPTWSGPDPWRTFFYYDPDTFEQCTILDCGGGRAPPKTTVPGCAAYEGTKTYSPLYVGMTTLTSAGAVVTEGYLTEGKPSNGNGKEAPKTKTTTASDKKGDSTATKTGDEESKITSMPTTETTMTKSEETATSKKGGDKESSDASSETETPASTGGANTSTSTDAAAMPTMGVMLGGCLIAGAAVMGAM